MADNEFEKKVRRLMDDFNIPPSEVVWEKVEKLIRPKKRRRLMWLLPSLLLVSVAAGYLLVQHKNQTEAKTQIPVDSTIALQETRKINNTDQNANDITNAPAVADADIKDVNSITTENRKNIATAIVPKANVNSYPEKAGVSPKLGELETLPAETIAEKNKTNNPEAVIKENVSETNTAKERHSDTGTTQAKAVIETGQLKVMGTMGDSLLKSKQNKVTQNKDQKNFKLQWGLDLFYGRTDNVQGLFSGNEDKALYQDYSSGSPGSGQSYQYKQPTVGPSLSLGFFVKKDISKRSNISAGLNFSMQKTKIETGNKIDSSAQFNNGFGLTSANSYYRSISDSFATNSITNKYQFLQVPVLWNYRFNNSKSLPLYLNAGIGLSALLNSDALIYDKSNSVFYSDNNLYKKIQMNFLFGLSAQINFKRTALVLGPQIQYAPTNLVKNKTYYGSQHLFNYGLHAGLLLKK